MFCTMCVGVEQTLTGCRGIHIRAASVPRWFTSNEDGTINELLENHAAIRNALANMGYDPSLATPEWIERTERCMREIWKLSEPIRLSGFVAGKATGQPATGKQQPTAAR